VAENWKVLGKDIDRIPFLIEETLSKLWCFSL